ncbi:MAG: XdhC family protein [Rhodobacteraceae bacterium]|nr:XdhC family protein [Paracoccaceae bacterium]
MKVKRPEHEQIPEIALTWFQECGAALATVIETWGSAPRPVGSLLAISADGAIAGSVSGGCVEGAVVAEALATLNSEKPKILEFGVADEDAFAVGLACGGNIKVLVEPINGPHGTNYERLSELVSWRSKGIPVIVEHNLINFNQRIIPQHSKHMTSALEERLKLDKSGLEGDLFFNVFNPPLKLIVVGGVHIAQPLMNMARQMGFQTVLIDPRSAFVTPSRFPNERINNEWPDKAIQEENPDLRTAIITLTHDSLIDDPAIIQALKTPAFYIGCLGSNRTHRKRIDRLTKIGVSESELKRLHAPIGLDIGSRTPAEIAVSVLAEIIQTLRRGF